MARLGRNRRRRARPANRSNATRVLATGVGASVPRAFGSTAGYSMACWDAKHPMHLALPRAVGPYATIRLTRRVSIDTHANIIGAFQEGAGNTVRGDWSNVVMISDVSSSQTINATNNVNYTTVNMGGVGSGATLVPSAISVQMMCPTALQTASGIVYAGVMSTQAAIAGRSESWATYMNRYVQYQNPRLLAASKLALRGVQINSYPLSMSQVSRFAPVVEESDGVTTYNGQSPESAGWAPIVIYNPSGVTLELLITVEYRVRFDLGNPASASHVHHPLAPDQVWDQLVRKASSLGNGVADIADVVANTGMAVGRAVAVGRRFAAAARGLPALIG